ncbi:MAG: ATP-grasp domain-containing protein [Chitinophaga sp.]|uniref:ATP-grasp domain-containing protein n=1 Tax=Chitinophaga sp. TaxID=1869181 RepID=UPI001B1ECD9E|nr:ATP-grasp domain-containing protein [Chitinophaga sp.]MBO9731732.1 ATP-grasp domain-containing protein [Chitinophaga sp.]
MHEKTLNILFLGGAKRTSIAEHFIKAGKERNINVKIFSYELDKFVPIAEVAEVIVGLRWKDENILAHLAQCIQDNHINIVLPFVDPAILISRHLGRLLPDIFIPVSDENICHIMFDKVSANDWFIQNAFPVPDNNTGNWPMIAKPRYGSASKGLIILKDDQSFARFKEEKETSDYLLQHFVVADEYTVDCYVGKNANIVSIVPRKRLEVAGGEAIKSITIKDDSIIDLSKQILMAGKFIGPITIQFLKEKSSGKVFVMEINPRLGGGVLTSIAAGADVVQYLLNDYQNIINAPFDQWRENLLMVRAFREFYFYADNN